MEFVAVDEYERRFGDDASIDDARPTPPEQVRIATEEREIGRALPRLSALFPQNWPF
ncbi:hypothetical protein ACQPZJ_47995 [Actinoplanes sp. CA-054009]